jgi:hypothetical protein
MELTKFLTQVWTSSVPILAIETIDQENTEDKIRSWSLERPNKVAVVSWTCLTGYVGVNEAGRQATVAICGEEAVARTADAADALRLCHLLPAGSILIFRNAHRFLGDATVSQGILLVRDPFKATGRTLILLGPAFQLPTEVAPEVILYSEDLPTDEEIASIAIRAVTDANREGAAIPMPSEATLKETTDAMRGLGAFTADQCLSLSLTITGFNSDQLWGHKKKAAEMIQGVSFHRGGSITLADVGGLASVKTWANRLMSSATAPRVVVYVDEIEKMIGGSSGPVADNTGVSQYYLGRILRWMDGGSNLCVRGAMFLGHPGGGKSYTARAIAGSHNRPTIELDLGALKGGLLGESEANLNRALAMIDAISGGNTLVIATCNGLDAIPPALRRRFNLGLWFFDLPDEEERQAIWRLQLAAHGLVENDRIGVNDENLTGADIRNICQTAKSLEIPLAEAAEYCTVPVAKADPGGIERLRQVANGRFLSASHRGVYRAEPPPVPPTVARKFDLGRGTN